MDKPAYKPWLYYLLPILVWSLFIMLPFISLPQDIPAWIRHRFLTGIILSNMMLLALFYIHTFLLYPLLHKGHRYTYFLSLIALLASYWVCWWLFKTNSPHPPAGSLPRGWHGPITYNPAAPNANNPTAFGPPMGGGPGLFIPVLSPFIALLCSCCYRIILDNNSRQKLIKERETVHLRTELNFLRSQINPHFLFNVLNNIISLVRKRSDRVEPAILNLSHLMRYMLYESDGIRVQLDKEIAYLKSYIDLQRLRFGDELTLSADLSGDYSSYHIGPMLLITLVENAYKHGTDIYNKSKIDIKLYILSDINQLHFKVMNDVEGDNNAAKNSGIGLDNLKRRLDILYPGKHQLIIFNDGIIFSAHLQLDLI